MQEIRRFVANAAGVRGPVSGPFAPSFACAGLLAFFAVACGSNSEQQSLPTVQVGISCTPGPSGCKSNVAPIYDDGEDQIFEVKKGVSFPILAPGATTRSELNKIKMDPYGRQPWVTTDDLDVQVTWTISNLDDTEHVVEMLIDPWNEFGRYFPGLQLTNPDEQKYMPNLSGIDKRYVVGAKSTGDGSRAHGTYTYADLKEVATDFATVMGIIKKPPMVPDDPRSMEDPTVIYTNHAFQWQNRSYDDLLVEPWVPPTVAGLTGLDIGFRTSEPANVAIEVAIELVDKTGKRVRPDGASDPLLPPTDKVVTVGVVAP